MATAEARKAKLSHPHKQVAIGDGRFPQWSPVFENNPHITPPEMLDPQRAHWVRNHIGNRPYIDYERTRDRLVYREDFRPEKGDFFPTEKETTRVAGLLQNARDFVVIEPHTKGSFSDNKRWPLERWQAVAGSLVKEGRHVVQLGPAGKAALDGVARVITPSFRWAWEAIRRASLVITAEGGMHHAAAAVGTPAVVLWGARTHPSILGYPEHKNLYTGDGESCGSIGPCDHCKRAMDRITVEMVLEACH